MLSKKFTAVAGATAAAAADDYFKNTTLLLSGDGTNGAQNNTFTDSSTNNFTITRNGNTTQGTFSPYTSAGGSWSNYFDGSSYLTNSSNPIPTSGNFTVEFWLNTATSSAHLFGYGFSGGFLIQVSSGYVLFGQYGVGVYTSSTLLPTNQWVHIAVVRNSSSWVLYQNGVSVATATWNPTFTSGNITIAGGAGGGAGSVTGYFSNVRVVNNATVYTGAFTPPTTPLTAVSGTQLLTCQSNRFIDSSGTSTLTATGTPSVQRFSPFNPTAAYSTSTVGGSGYFDGSGDWIRTAGNAVYDMGSGDFTVEAWVYPQGSGNRRFVDYSNGTAANSNFSFVLKVTSSNTIYGAVYVGGTEYSITSTETFSNTWVHVALVRNGTGSNNLKLYVNGVSVGTPQSISTNSINTLTGTPYLSISSYYNGSGEIFNGYVDDVRITKGGALYTATFTPPVAPLTTTVSSGTVSLLTNMTNAGIYDSAMMNNLETVGNAQISTSTKKYGTASMYFDGTGDYLKFLSTPDTRFGSGDLTIEGWIQSTSISTTQAVLERRSSLAANGIAIYLDASKLSFRAGDSNTTAWEVIIDSGTLSSNVWYHFALTRSGSTWKAFIDGTQVGSSVTWSGTIDAETSNWLIGIFFDASGGLNGYLDDLRITKGYARYTSNFTAPTEALPNY